ncbi:MAG: lipoprotein [Clostridium sp.]
MINKKNLIMTIVTVVIVITGIIGVSGYVINNYAGNYQKSIYENDSKIIEKSDSYSYFNQVRSNIDGTLKSKFKFTGMDTIYNLNTKDGGTISINYNANIISGKFKLVLINPDDEVTTIVEGTGKGTKKISLGNGESRLKLVGKNAKGDIKLSIDAKDDIEIEYLDN